MICKMAASGLEAIVTKVADSLGYRLKAEQKEAILSFIEGKDVFVSLLHSDHDRARTEKTLRKSSTATMHTLRNNYIPLPQLTLRKCTRPFRGVGRVWLARLYTPQRRGITNTYIRYVKPYINRVMKTI